MGVTAKIFQHLLGTTERRLGVDHPLGTCCTRQVTWTARYPAHTVGRYPTTWHHAVQMRVMQQILSPSVQDGNKADLGTQMLGVARDGAQGFGGGSKQDVVDQRLVLVRDRRNLLRHGEDDVEILDRQQLGLPVLKPLSTHQRLTLGAMAIAATVEGDALVPTGIALLDVTTQRRSATLLNGTHDAALPAAQSRRMLRTIGRADQAKDVRHLQPDRTQDKSSEMNRWTGRGWGQVNLWQ